MLHGMHGRLVQQLLRLVEAHSAAMRFLVEEVCSRLPWACRAKLIALHIQNIHVHMCVWSEPHRPWTYTILYEELFQPNHRF